MTVTKTGVLEEVISPFQEILVGWSEAEGECRWHMLAPESTLAGSLMCVKLGAYTLDRCLR